MKWKIQNAFLWILYWGIWAVVAVEIAALLGLFFPKRFGAGLDFMVNIVSKALPEQ